MKKTVKNPAFFKTKGIIYIFLAKNNMVMILYL